MATNQARDSAEFTDPRWITIETAPQCYPF
jgi:hypothetical protein